MLLRLIRRVFPFGGEKMGGEKTQKVRLSWGRRLQLAAVVVALGGALFFGFLEYTQRPQFCVTCHYMEPYYKSWEESSHHQVNCLKCHYPPGFQSVVRAKIVALSQVVQYVTKTYGTKPWAEIEDAACLRSGCHETRLLAGTVPFGPDGTIRFDHSHHLKDLKRGKQLRCTSCHAQIVQGQHLTVNPATCFLCHFKSAAWQQNLSRCQTCHDVSKIPANRFDHAHILANNVDCRRCHGDITRGTGEVPKQHCLSCHNEAHRLAQYDDVGLLHTTHVSEHKVECSECHIEITHSNRRVSLAEGLNCKDCHLATHENQLRLFVGVSAVEPHRPPEPGPMYQVNVHCVGCHTNEKKLEGGGRVQYTTSESCDTCHSPGYGAILQEWRQLLSLRMAETEQALAMISRQMEINRSGDSALAAALGKLEEVKTGHGVHNIGFALALLAEAQATAQTVGRQLGVEVAVSRVPEAKLMRDNECRLCHLQPPTKTINFHGKAFPHGVHAQAVEQCTSCHTPRSDHGKTTLKPEDCADCHGGIAMPHPPGFRQQAGAILQKTGFAACAVCHRGEKAENCGPCHQLPADSTVEGGPFSHAKHMAHPEVRCVSCHSAPPDHGRVTVSKAQCTACHGGVAMPHPDDWVESHPSYARENGVEACEKCHAGGMSGAFCATCHG